MDVPMHTRHTHSSDRTVSCHLIFPELMAAPGEFRGAKGGGGEPTLLILRVIFHLTRSLRAFSGVSAH